MCLATLCCETDFVAKSNDFETAGQTLADYALACSADSGAQAILETEMNGKKFGDCLTELVSKTGEISDITVLRGIGGGCDEEAVRVVKLMPKWEPGKQRGVPVKVRFTLPVKFILY